MNSFYLDTSALIKRYLDEVGSVWMRTLVAEQPTAIVTSHLTAVEGACALARRWYGRLLDDQDYHRLLEAFAHDMQYEYQVVAANSRTIDWARQLAGRYPLRAYDAVQLASGCLANQVLVQAQHPPLTFVCADVRLLNIARAEGLPVDNPNDHR